MKSSYYFVTNVGSKCVNTPFRCVVATSAWSVYLLCYKKSISCFERNVGSKMKIPDIA